MTTLLLHYQSLNDLVSFARFVSYAEYLDRISELFEDEKSKAEYHQLWFELEIINACALSEWEQEGKPTDWQKRWESDYKQDASELMSELLSILK
ncbi:hypothetical protein GN242_19400 [Erwinia sorbitola]|uniref:Uncharacterized protein n=1 Tax=Erwinia sorbitola TaxID=2681984 RepID=A0A6I6EVV7_9GAMM|nr:hypothetical protein GN242_19400 [Erwinia sorbitola]